MDKFPFLPRTAILVYRWRSVGAGNAGGLCVFTGTADWLARYQTPHQRLQSGIDAILHVLDWIPVRLAGVVYALLGHGEKALPARFASLADLHTSQYQVLTRLAQFSLVREPHTDKVETPKAAVSMAKKASFVVVVIIALLTIYGALV